MYYFWKTTQTLGFTPLVSVVGRHVWGHPQECVITLTFFTSYWLLKPQPYVTLPVYSESSVLFMYCICVCLCPPALEAERVFGVLSFLMAVSTGALCLVFALCWTSQTVRSYSNTRSLLMAGQALYPTTLLLLTMASTGNTPTLLTICETFVLLSLTACFYFHFINNLSVVVLGVFFKNNIYISSNIIKIASFPINLQIAFWFM